MVKIFIAIALLGISSVCFAVTDIQEFKNDKQRSLFIQLTNELRCPKCQNQNLADSNSQISIIMRDVVADELREGSSADDIKALMVGRYGEFVLYRPPVNAKTRLLWWTPKIMLGIALCVFIMVVLKRSRIEK